MDYAIRTLSQLRPILQGFRKAAGLTQAAMAAHLGVTQQTYAQLEANPSAVSVERLFRVLRVLQVDLKLSQSGSAHSVATEDTGAPATANAKRATRVPPQQGTSAQPPARAQEPAQRAATASPREASGSAAAKASGTAAKAARSASAAQKPKAVKLAKAAKAAGTSKKREDW